MKSYRIVYIFLALLFVCSCNQEKSTLTDYKRLTRELKVNSSDYTEEDWEEIIEKYESLEEAADRCHFSPKEKRELNRLRGQCAAYLFKAMANQTKYQMEDFLEQLSDMAEGFQDVLGDESIDSFLNDDEEE